MATITETLPAVAHEPAAVSEKSVDEKGSSSDEKRSLKDLEDKVDFTDVRHLNENVLAVDMHIGDVFEDKRAIDLGADGKERPITTSEDYALRLLSIEDDVTLPVFTFRFLFLGLALSCFGAVLSQLFYFRPQTIYVSQLQTVSALKTSDNAFWRFFNPGTFNIKEHVGILIMSATASDVTLGISIFATQDLYYNQKPNIGTGIFTLISSQLIGYAGAGLCRAFLVWPTYAVYPHIVPQVQLFDMLHRGKGVVLQKKRWKRVFIIFVSSGSLLPLFSCGSGFLSEYLPFIYCSYTNALTRYIAPTLTGVSIFCLANQDSPWFTRVFGGSNGNEGLGMFSLCFDWAYVGSGGGAIGSLFTPLSTQLSLYAGCAVCIIAFCACYAQNTWNAQNFPFLSQLLFYENGTEYDQLRILDDQYQLDYDKLAVEGLPWYAASQLLYRLSRTMYIGAAITHFALWHAKDVWGLIRNGKDKIDDVHYTLMKKYPEVPWYWYAGLGGATFAMAMACIYTAKSGVPWYGLIVALIFAGFFMPIIGTLYCTVGYCSFHRVLDPNAWWCCYSRKACRQHVFHLVLATSPSSKALICSVTSKWASTPKLPPRITFFCQCVGSIVGAILSLVIMKVVMSNPVTHEILRDVQGTNVWSGQQIQSYNSDAVAWGALGKPLYAQGTQYAFVPYMLFAGLGFPIPFYLLHKKWPSFGWNNVFTPILVAELGYLSVGINSSVFTSFLLAVFSQYYLRKYHSRWFRKYNFLLSAALDGGTMVMIFICAVIRLLEVPSGKTTPFPSWALNPAKGNLDYCKRLTD
ncbi:OPT oligopeptide transporter [Flagelloscypha sp. PMI_526]|nr:OPT oligopeptide transporter [Flagelloscypha sp. PMI_526]